MFNFSLRARLVLLTTVAIAPAIIILIFNLISLRQSREAEVHATALQTGKLAALEMQRIVAGQPGCSTPSPTGSNACPGHSSGVKDFPAWGLL